MNILKNIPVFFLLVLKIHASNDWSQIIHEINGSDSSYNLAPITGGASNINYHLILNDESHYFLHFSPKLHEAPYASLEVEYDVLTLLGPLGISANPIYCDYTTRAFVTNFIDHDNEELNLLNPKTRQAIIKMIHEIEDADIKISRTFQPYQDIMQLIQEAKSLNNNLLSNDFYDFTSLKLKQIDELLSKYPKKHLCHFDLHSKNILRNNDKFWIVDWEYATMGHPFLGLASTASLEKWDDIQMKRFLNDYMDLPTEADFYHVYLYRIVVDLFWATWSHVQASNSIIDYPYESLAKELQNTILQRINSEVFTKAITWLK